MGFWVSKNSEGKPGIGFGVIFLVGAFIVAGAYLFMTGTPGIASNQAPTQAKEGSPIQRSETKLTSQEEIPAELARARDREKQIAREQSGFLRPEDLEKRQQEIDEKYQRLAEAQRKSGALRSSERLTQFDQPDATPTPTQEKVATAPTYEGYLTLDERLQAEGKTIQGDGAGQTSSAITLQPGRIKPPSRTTDSIGNPGDTTQITNTGPGEKPVNNSNLLPTGTWIPCTLDQDVISTDLRSQIWVTVVQDVTFRRQLQIPQQLVKLRGTAAVEPVQNLLDIQFDLAVFADGTELPLSGNAYSAFDIRYPNRFRVRGIVGKLNVPPLFIQLKNLVYSVAGGVSQAVAQNYTQGQTQQQQNFQGNSNVNPLTGQITGGETQGTTSNPRNQNIAGTLLAEGGANAFETYTQTEIAKDLERYRPYVEIQKGTPLWVQLDSGLNLDARQLNGLNIAREEQAQRELQLVAAGYLSPDALLQDNAPKGDAGYRYDGGQRSNPALVSSNGPIPPGMANNPANLQQAQTQANQIRDALTQMKLNSGGNAGGLPPPVRTNPENNQPTGGSNPQNSQAILQLLQQSQ